MWKCTFAENIRIFFFTNFSTSQIIHLTRFRRSSCTDYFRSRPLPIFDIISSECQVQPNECGRQRFKYLIFLANIRTFGAHIHLVALDIHSILDRISVKVDCENNLCKSCVEILFNKRSVTC